MLDQLERNGLLSDARTAEAYVRSHAAPVSYTHLRAHETVLDLVCRLLLEKKKLIFLCVRLLFVSEKTDIVVYDLRYYPNVEYLLS